MSLPSPGARPLFVSVFVAGLLSTGLRFCAFVARGRLCVVPHQLLPVVFSGFRLRNLRPSLRTKAARAVREEPRVRVTPLLLVVVVQAAAKGAGFLRSWLPIRADGSLIRLRFCTLFSALRRRRASSSMSMVVMRKTTIGTRWRSLLRRPLPGRALLRRALPGRALSGGLLRPLQRGLRRCWNCSNTRTHARTDAHGHAHANTHTDTHAHIRYGGLGAGLRMLLIRAVESVAWLGLMKETFSPGVAGGLHQQGPQHAIVPMDVVGRSWRGCCLG